MPCSKYPSQLWLICHVILRSQSGYDSTIHFTFREKTTKLSKPCVSCFSLWSGTKWFFKFQSTKQLQRKNLGAVATTRGQKSSVATGFLLLRTMPLGMIIWMWISLSAKDGVEALFFPNKGFEWFDTILWGLTTVYILSHFGMLGTQLHRNFSSS